MSFWTHFIGTMQFCSSSYEEVEAILGKPTLWPEFDYHLPKDEFMSQVEDFSNNIWMPAIEAWDNGTGMPMGSEGSINWKYSDTSKENKNVFGEGTLIAIEGDLRDFGADIEDIRKSMLWFRSKCFALGAREAVLRIQADGWYNFIIYGCRDNLIVHAFKRDELVLSYSWKYQRREEQWHTKLLFNNLTDTSDLKHLIPEVVL